MTIKAAIKSKNVKELRKIAQNTPVAEVADLIESLTPSEQVLFFRLLNTDLQSEIFASLEPDYQEALVKTFSDQQIKKIIGELYADEIADIIEEVPEDIAQRIIKNTPKERREDVNKILRYNEDQVGSIMTVDILPIKQTLKVSEAIKLIKEHKDLIYMGHYFFVVDSKGSLTGSITIEDLMFSNDSKKIKDLAKPIGYVQTTTSNEEAAIRFADHDMSVLPVVNSSKQVIGAITADDMIDVIQEEATEDFKKMAGIGADETPYSKTNTKSLFKSRILWLMLLMISATLSQIVLDAFQHASNSKFGTAIWVTTAVVAILPVISGAAGNAGSQSSTMVIRSLAIGDISTKDYKKVMFKEIKVSSLIGLALALANFVRLIIYYSVSGDLTGSHGNEHIYLSLAASIALAVVIMLAKVTGGTLPLLAKKLHIDPAVMAAPLLTTLIDALSTAIFFGISIGIMELVI